MIIRKYTNTDADGVMKIIELEGEEWRDYSAPENQAKFKKALENCIVYVAVVDHEIVGFSRSIKDNDLWIVVGDLLVNPKFRGQGIGKMLLDVIKNDYPTLNAYVMSDNDVYYSKQDYKRVGSIFKV